MQAIGAESDKKLTPLMKQYWEVKSAHMDKILFFRMGDFYELFDQDAIKAAPLLGIALTSRNKNQGDSTALCGMPHHSAANYINKLLGFNFKVAICDQVEDPATAKGIVKRAVTRILSPGMVYDPDTIDQIKSNYICSFDSETVSFLEASTGEAFFYKYANTQELYKLIGILSPVEMVLGKDLFEKVLEEKKSLDGPCLTQHNTLSESAPCDSAKRLLNYAVYMQGEKILQTLQNFEERFLAQRMELNPQVLKHLEIFETYRGESRGSFFHAINKTKTAAGSRKLKNWMLFPLQNRDEILKRQKEVGKWVADAGALKTVRDIFAKMGDIERRLGKISNPTCNARDFISLKNSLAAGLEISAWAKTHKTNELKIAHDLILKIESTIVDEPPLATKNGHMIRKGFSPDLDQMIRLTEDTQGLLNEMEAREREATQISSLKIRYNSVFGFYIEVTKGNVDKVPKHYVRKQTLTNAERYITDELHKLETQVLSAKAKREEFEFTIFENLKTEILKSAANLGKLAHDWSEVDVFTGLAWLAIEMNYCKANINNDRTLRLYGSRHPVIEQFTQTQFVPNDIEIHPHGCLLLTGPNMAGKSTIMRQVALTVWLAQIGSYVPAREASLPIFDRLFTRIGASDSLTEGLSTFMVEMTETAYLLKNATEQSLVILDEIGRGTSTYDGMSLAQAILEYLVTHVRSMTLFATHYHELTSLQSKYAQIENGHMKIAEKGNKDITFLYTLTRGPANKSYGIEVAKLAGLPAAVTGLARKILDSKELSQESNLPLFSFAPETKMKEFFTENDAKVLEGMRAIDLDKLTPMQALNQLNEWKKDL